MDAASYTPLSEGTYEIPYAAVLYRRAGSNDGFVDGGDVDSFMLNLNPTRKQRYGKNARVSELRSEVTVRIDSTITAKFMQKTDFIRAAALMGTILKVTQPVGPLSKDYANLVPGQFYSVGGYGISTPSVKYDNGSGALVVLPPVYWRMVDPALGLIEILGLPADAEHDPDTGYVAGQVAATVTAADAQAAAGTRIDIGTVPDVRLEMIVRNLSDIGPKGYLHIWQANLASDGDMGFITANDDFEGVTVKGRAATGVDPVTGRAAVGYWRSLPA